MRKITIWSGSIFLLAVSFAIADEVAAPPAAPAQAPVVAGGTAKIKFEQAAYDFGKVSAGEVVKHTFYFTNAGDQLLEVKNVQPSCGCTTAGEWSHKVEPGKVGTIAIQFNSHNFNGSVTKTVTVTSNDRSQPSAVLQIKGTVWRPIEVTPQFAVLTVVPELATNAPAKIKIVNNVDTPVTLSAPESNHHGFSTELKTIQPGKEFELIVSAVPPFNPGNMQGTITVKTSSTNMPVISITAWANVQPVIAVTPQQLVLPRSPLPNQLSPSVTIQNRGTNHLVLSEPKVNVEGVQAEIRETQAGHTFTATVTFPGGFQIAQGQQVELTMKSNHPQHPLIKVPIIQMPGPANQAKANIPNVPGAQPSVPRARPTIAPQSPPPVPGTPPSTTPSPEKTSSQ